MSEEEKNKIEKEEEKEGSVKTSITLPKSMYLKLLEISYERSKKEMRRVKITELIREAIAHYYNIS